MAWLTKRESLLLENEIKWLGYFEFGSGQPRFGLFIYFLIAPSKETHLFPFSIH